MPMSIGGMMTNAPLESVAISRRGNDAVICVPRRCKFTRIIVSVSRNNAQWLTPLGWRPEEKSIALKCDNTSNGLEIYLPKKFVNEIDPSDTLALSCLELSFEGKMKWGGMRAVLVDSPAAVTKAAFNETGTDLSGLATQSEGTGLPKKYILGGVSAVVLLGVIGFSFLGGDKPSAVSTQMVKTEQAELPLSDPKAPKPNVDVQSAAQQKRDAAKAVAAEIALKKDEADRAAAKIIQDEKDAVAAEKKAKRDAENKLKADKLAAENKAKAEKAALAAEKKRKAEAKKRAEEKAKAAELSAKAAPKIPAPADKAPAPETPMPELRPNQLALTTEEISEMQNSLSVMGYYSGPVDGTLSTTTLSSAVVFKTIFDLSANSEIDKNFAKEVRKQREIYDARTPVIEPKPVINSEPIVAPEPIVIPSDEAAVDTQLAEMPLVPQDVPKAVTKSPKLIDREPALEPVPESESESESEPETEPVAEAMVDRKILVQPAPDYPKRPGRRANFSEVVKVTVSYTVDKRGRPENINIVENSHEGMFIQDFNKAVLRAADKKRYAPISVDDPPDLKIYRTTYTFKQ